MVDDWSPSASLDLLKARAAFLTRLRAFFMQAGVLEVETPALSCYGGTDPAIESLKTRYTGPGAADGLELTLHTSPEFPMKRLLAAGSGPIYQISRVFRDGESGRLHNPEFTLLEWYRPGFDHHDLMGEMAALVRSVVNSGLPEERISYRDLFLEHCAVDPHDCTVNELVDTAKKLGVSGAAELVLDASDSWLDLLLTHLIEPKLGRGKMTFIYDYPASQASLARIRHGDNVDVAERFELYLNGTEIANGFHELGDAAELQRRFEADNRERRKSGQMEQSMDQRLLAALDAGFPDCAGVALGVDRLLMVMEGADSIEQVMAFPIGRA